MIENSFYFIRHGETALNAQEKCCGGGSDIPLNTKGRKQAEQLRDVVKEFHFSKVISSPMKRARETAQLILGDTFTVVDALKEWHIGIYEGQDLALFLPYIKNHPDTTPVSGGESKRAFFDRVIIPIHDAINQYKTDFLIVAHGGVYWSILDAFNLPYDHIENCQLARFYKKGGAWSKEMLSGVS